MTLDILKTNDDRFILHPIKYNDVWDYYKQAAASVWFSEEIDMSKDKHDFDTKLSKDEQYFIKMVLAFFAASDGIVNENLAERFMNEIQIPEIRCFYGFQIAIENIHSETYALLLQTIEKDSIEQKRLFQATRTIPSIKKKAEWAMKYIESTEDFATRLIAFACVEGIFFSSSFAAIFWLRKKGLMPGLTFSNELISRDEGLHRDFACLLYRKYIISKNDTVVDTIVREAVQIEKDFIKESLPNNLLGMNSAKMCEYVEFVGDHLLTSMDRPKLFHTENPFEFMELISLQGKTNFFEKRVGEYQKSGVKDGMDFSFKTDEDF